MIFRQDFEFQKCLWSLLVIPKLMYILQKNCSTRFTLWWDRYSSALCLGIKTWLVTTAHDNWPIHSDITNPSRSCLPSRKPRWQDLVSLDIRSQWKENWRLAQVVNFSLVDDRTIRQPGFNLPRQQWSLLNRFGLCRVTVVSVRSYGIRQPLICIFAVRNKRCPTLSPLVFWRN